MVTGRKPTPCGPYCLACSSGREASPERDEHDRCTGCLYSAGHALDCPLYPQPEPGRETTADHAYDCRCRTCEQEAAAEWVRMHDSWGVLDDPETPPARETT